MTRRYTGRTNAVEELASRLTSTALTTQTRPREGAPRYAPC